MKKFIAITLVLSLCFALLCACKKDDSKNSGSAEEATTGAVEETTIDITTLGNYYQDLTAPEVVAGQVTYKVYQAWWEEDELVVQMYIINGMDAPIEELFIEDYAAYTEEGQIAQITVGPLGLDPIPAGEYVLETFYFGIGVDLPDADLSTLSIECVIDFYY